MSKAAAERIWPLQGGVWPLAETSFHEAADLWRSNRAELLRLARSAETDSRAVFAHPGSGSMDLVLMCGSFTRTPGIMSFNWIG